MRSKWEWRRHTQRRIFGFLELEIEIYAERATRNERFGVLIIRSRSVTKEENKQRNCISSWGLHTILFDGYLINCGLLFRNIFYHVGFLVHFFHFGISWSWCDKILVFNSEKIFAFLGKVSGSVHTGAHLNSSICKVASLSNCKSRMQFKLLTSWYASWQHTLYNKHSQPRGETFLSLGRDTIISNSMRYCDTNLAKIMNLSLSLFVS